MNSKIEALPASRDQRFDTMRGLLLVCMTINHLPTEIRTVTDQSFGVFSAAEGFVFVSGFMAGWIYTRKLRKLGHDGLWTASMNRSKAIYFWHIVSFLAAFACVQLTGHFLGFCSTTSPRLFFEHPITSLCLGFSLLYQPGLLDLLPMYCAFVLLIPAVVGSLEAGRRWVVLGVSAAVWLSVQWAPPMAGAPIFFINTGTFNLFAWQFIFVAGMVVGHAEKACGQPQVARPSPWVLAGVVAVAVYALGVRQFQWISLWPDRIYGIFLNKPSLGLLRLADFAAVAYLVAIVGTRFPRALSWRPLAFLGRHSLVVVAAQSVAVVTLLQFSPLFATALGRTLTVLGTVGFLFLAAAAHEKFARRARTGAPAPIDTRQGAERPVLPADDAKAA